jgi:acetamidase/formamidase
VDPDFVLELGQQVLAEWKIDRDAQKATLQKADSTLNSFSLPLAPMLGCLGVAPASGQLISAATSAEHGGNLNYNGLVQGVTVYFPVFVAGALLYLGDGHAVQGDGEMGGSGIEVSMDVRFTVHVIKSAPINRVRGEDKEWIFTIGSARPLDQAVQHATTEMLRWLVADYGLDAFSASVLLGQTARYDLGNMCDPAYTMVCKINKNVVLAAQDHHSR